MLILTNRVPYPLTDGGNLAMDATLSAYLDSGLSVYLLSMNTRRHPVSQEVWSRLYPGLAGKSMVSVDNRIALIPMLGNWIFSRLPYHVPRFRDPGFARELESVIREFQPDFIQFESVFLSSYIPRIRELTPAKLVLRLHNLEYQIWERLSWRETGPIRKAYLSSLARRMRRYEETVWNLYDLLLPITPEDGRRLAEAARDKPQVCWPFGLKEFGEGKPQDRPLRRFYHLGAMDWIPNQEGIDWFLVQVWPRMESVMADGEFHFGGRNMPPRFRNYQRKGVFVHGQVPSAPDFIRDMDILVVPLLSSGGIRVKILEAMAAGKLVISTRRGMEGIDALSGKHYFLADSPEAFQEAAEQILCHPARVREMIREAQDWVAQHYASQKLARPVLETLEGLKAGQRD